MAISFDTTSTAQNSGSTNQVPPLVTTWSHTVGAGTDRLLILAVVYNANGGGTGTFTVTYNGATMTAKGNASDTSIGIGKIIFYLVDPDVGTHDIVVTLPGTSPVNVISDLGFIAASYFGVKGSTIASESGTASDANASASVTVINDNSWVVGLITRDSDLAPTITTGTQRLEIDITSLGEGFAFVDNGTFAAGATGTIASSNGRNACCMSVSPTITATGAAFLLNFI